MRRLKGKLVKLGFDFVLATASVAGAFYLYTRGHLPPLDGVIHQGLIFAGFYTVFSLVFGTHRTVWRYTSVADLVDIGRAALMALFCFGLFQHFLMPNLIYSPPFIVTQGLVLMALMTGQRLFHRVLHEGFLFKNFANTDGASRSRILLVGAGSAADKFIKAVRLNPHYGYEIVGIVDNNRTLFGEMMHGVPILGKGKHLERILKELAQVGKSPQRLVFTETAAGSGSADLMDIPVAILGRAEDFGLKLSRLPNLTLLSEGLETLDDGSDHVALKPIAIEDLLGRPQSVLDVKSIRDLIAGKRVVITGAGGSIGGELACQIAKFNPGAMALLDFSEYNLYAIEQDMVDLQTDVPYRCLLCNVRVAEQVRKVFADFCPDIVFHAAALKHVPLVEANPSEGVLTNIMGTRVVAEACLEFGAGTMVQISTDKAVNPCNVMGATKRLGESLAQALDLEEGSTRFVTVRFGNVLGSSGSVVPLFRKQLERGGPLTVTHPEISRFFMTIREAVSLVLQASSHAMRHHNERGRILVLDMGEPVKIVEVAKQMIRLANLRPDIDVKINFIGLRPGEKMYEELFDANEQRIQTDSPHILAAVSQPIDAGLLRRSVTNLEDAARKGDDEAVIRLLKTVVPGYTGDPAAGHPKDTVQERKKA